MNIKIHMAFVCTSKFERNTWFEIEECFYFYHVSFFVSWHAVVTRINCFAWNVGWTNVNMHKMLLNWHLNRLHRHFVQSSHRISFFISILFYSFTLVILELWYYIVSPSVMKGSMVYSLNRFIFLGLFLKPTEATTKENANVRWWRWYFSGYTLTNKDNCCRFSCVVFVANGNCQCCMCLLRVPNVIKLPLHETNVSLAKTIGFFFVFVMLPFFFRHKSGYESYFGNEYSLMGLLCKYHTQMCAIALAKRNKSKTFRGSRKRLAYQIINEKYFWCTQQFPHWKSTKLKERQKNIFNKFIVII